jgi:RNA polymerase sigma factor (sigma-70 family)
MVEDQLWSAIRDNDKDAFTAMYKAYYQLLFAEGFRNCADKDLVKDCIHELFLELWHNRSKLPPVQHVGAYLRTYLKRKIRREVERSPRHYAVEDMETRVKEMEYPYEELLIRLQSKHEMVEKVRMALSRLSPRQVEIIRMKFFENRSYEEISTLTTTTPRTIYNQVYDSLKILRKYLKMVFIV